MNTEQKIDKIMDTLTTIKIDLAIVKNTVQNLPCKDCKEKTENNKKEIQNIKQFNSKLVGVAVTFMLCIGTICTFVGYLIGNA